MRWHNIGKRTLHCSQKFVSAVRLRAGDLSICKFVLTVTLYGDFAGSGICTKPETSFAYYLHIVLFQIKHGTK
jgi:hypothetical protein